MLCCVMLPKKIKAQKDLLFRISQTPNRSYPININTLIEGKAAVRIREYFSL